MLVSKKFRKSPLFDGIRCKTVVIIVLATCCHIASTVKIRTQSQVKHSSQFTMRSPRAYGEHIASACFDRSRNWGTLCVGGLHSPEKRREKRKRSTIGRVGKMETRMTRCCETDTPSSMSSSVPEIRFSGRVFRQSGGRLLSSPSHIL